MEISIAAARVNAGYTQPELAKALDVSLATITSWEHGRTEPSISQFRKISEITGISIDYLVCVYNPKI